MDKDEDRVVLRRGKVEHDWHKVRREPSPIGSTEAPAPRAGLARWVPLFIVGILAASAIGLLVVLAFG